MELFFKFGGTQLCISAFGTPWFGQKMHGYNNVFTYFLQFSIYFTFYFWLANTLTVFFKENISLLFLVPRHLKASNFINLLYDLP